MSLQNGILQTEVMGPPNLELALSIGSHWAHNLADGWVCCDRAERVPFLTTPSSPSTQSTARDGEPQARTRHRSRRILELHGGRSQESRQHEKHKPQVPFCVESSRRRVTENDRFCCVCLAYLEQHRLLDSNQTTRYICHDRPTLCLFDTIKT